MFFILPKLVFWGSVVFIFYTYFGYPIAVYLWSLFKDKKLEKRYIFPRISVVIAALNEEKYIKRKIENILGQDYPPDKMEIIIISDASVDKTEAIVRSFQGSRNNVKLYAFKKRRGKAAAINFGLSKAIGDMIVFTDARQTFDVHTIKELVANFHDESVGAVSGELLLVSIDHKISDSIRLYWNFEKWIRKSESRIDSAVGATGAVYTIRKKLFETIPENAILDDLLIPMKIILKGYRVVFDEKAVAYDDALIESRSELRRKIRTLTGNFQILHLMPEILSHKKNRLFFNYFSHKIVRLIAPIFFLALLISNMLLANGLYLYFLVAQVLLYSVAMLGFSIKHPESNLKYLFIPATFLLLNYAVVLAFFNYIRKKEDVWDKS